MSKLAWSSELYSAVKERKVSTHNNNSNESFERLATSEKTAVETVFEGSNNFVSPDGIWV